MWLIIQVKRVARVLVPFIILCPIVVGGYNWFNLFLSLPRNVWAIGISRIIAIVKRMGNGHARRRVFVGLINQGATCYLNTLLQTWFLTPEVRHCFDRFETEVPFICKLQSLFKKLESRNEMCLSTEELTTSLRLNVFEQCDIEQWFRHLINKINSEVDQGHRILELYQIRIAQTMKCSKCATLVEDDCFLMDLPLSIHSAHSSEQIKCLEEAIQEYLEEDTVDGDNASYCDHCGTKTKTEINSNEWCFKPTTDKVNNAHNNHATGRGSSLLQPSAKQKEDPGNTDRTVDEGEERRSVTAQDRSQQDSPGEMGKEEQDSTEEMEKKYELFAIWHHHGGYGSGHYYADIKSVDGDWYTFNDRTVKKIKQVSMRSKTVYMIMYRRKGSEVLPRIVYSNDWHGTPEMSLKQSMSFMKHRTDTPDNHTHVESNQGPQKQNCTVVQPYCGTTV
ncbi:ubiquitin carboxyl-terminal hydrolase 47-like isoform X2 [Heterodontus francisci]|uniref:ubiquitin carboxyl-terminal hydrolase 47-like isoform X2 n=1 Tax=Heterodontus francisci TaxID=7792 RepID=UPI00355B2568